MLELMKKRRSIRKYTDKKIEDEKIEILKKVALLSPTGKNKKEWDFIFVDDKNLLSKLASVKPEGGKMLENATLGIVVTADEEKSDTWVEDASIAATTIHYTAQDLGLGSCWIQIKDRMFDYDKMIRSESMVQDILGLPEKQRVLCIISIGYPNEIKTENDFEKLEYSKIHINKF